MLVDGYTPPTVNIRTVAIYKFHLIAKGVWVVTTIYQFEFLPCLSSTRS